MMRGRSAAPEEGELGLKGLNPLFEPYPNVMVGLNPNRTEAQMTAKISSASTMHIGELAERTGLSLRTIRHYDDVGLLPATARTHGGFRVYSQNDFERLMVIKQMKPLGFSLEEMAEILGLLTGVPEAPGYAARLAEILEQAAHQRAKMARNLAQADDFIAMLGRFATE